jgi:hypothetical protein
VSAKSLSRRQAEQGRCLCENLRIAHRSIAKRDVYVGVMLKENVVMVIFFHIDRTP